MNSKLPKWEGPATPKHPLFEMPPIYYPEQDKPSPNYRPRISEYCAQQIITLYEAGFTQAQVAEKLGVSRVTVKRYLGVRPYNRH